MNGHFTRRQIHHALLRAAGLAAALRATGWPKPLRAGAEDFVADLPLVPVPAVTAKAVYAIDTSAGVELMNSNADEQLPPASTAKMMTAIVTVENADIAETVTFNGADSTSDGESTAGLIEGDVVTVGDLLYAALVQSGNDAARGLARYVGGKLLSAEGVDGDPIARFVQAMNDYAAQIGLQNTWFADPAGIDSNTISSARDLARMGANLLRGRKFLTEVVNTSAYILAIEGPNAREVTLQTSNKLLGYVEDLHGIKTGSNNQGGTIVVAKYEHGRNRLITVVMQSDLQFDEDGFQIPDSDMRYPDTLAVLAAVEAAYTWVDPTQDEVAGLLTELTAWNVELEDQSSILVPTDATESVTYTLELAPEGSGVEPVGRVLFFIGSKPIAERSVMTLGTGG